MTDNYFGLTDTGKMRSNNEDTFIAAKVLNNRYIMACVVDGVGGYEGGEVAAEITRGAILEYFSIPSGDVPTMMKESLTIANEKIHTEKLRTRDKNDMACVVTLAVVDVENNLFYYAHVGDTRLYLLRDHSLVKITKDHSFVGFLEDSGRLTEEAAMSHPKRNEINKALGFDTQIRMNAEYLETGQSPFLPGDMLLLCSDGLTDLVNRKDITEVLTQNKSLEEKAKDLIEAANKAGGKDNITVVLVQNDSKPLKQKATRPVAVIKNGQDEPEDGQYTTAPGAQITEKKEESPGQSTKKNSKSAVVVLSLICILLLAALLWMLFQRTTMEDATLFHTTRSQQNPQERKISDTIIHLAGSKLFLTDSLFPQPVVLTDTLWIQKDSLHIRGGDRTVFRADSAFAGPALMLLSSCKYVLLENMTFENFTVAMAAQNKSLHLKNVRFKNCRIPVQYHFNFPANSSVSGSIMDDSFLVTDSVK